MLINKSYYTIEKGVVNAVFVPFTKVVNASKKLYNTCIDTNKRSWNNAEKASARLD